MDCIFPKRVNANFKFVSDLDGLVDLKCIYLEKETKGTILVELVGRNEQLKSFAETKRNIR